MLKRIAFLLFIAGLPVGVPVKSWGAATQATAVRAARVNPRQAAVDMLARKTAARPGAKAPAAAQSASRKTTTPFASPLQRLLAPQIQHVLGQQKLQSAAAEPHANDAQALPIHLPGFLQASPIVSTTQGDSTFTWASLSADVNNDGMPDVVTVQDDGALNVLLNPGKGKLGSLAVSSTNTSAVNGTADVTMVYAADLNNDGYTDIVASDAGNSALLIFLNKGNGTFRDAVTYAIPFTASYGLPALYAGGVFIADFNNDGALDLVVLTVDSYYPDFSTSTSELFTFLGRGDGSFTPLPEATSTFPGELETLGQFGVSDTDGDGNPDLVFLASATDNSWNSAIFIAVAKSDGNGGFTGMPQAVPTSGALIPDLGLGGDGALFVQDLNGDGIADALFFSGYTGLYFAPGDGHGGFGDATAVIPGLAKASLMNLADVTGDGKPDAITYSNGEIAVYAGAGNGTFAATPMVRLAAGAGGDQQPTPADFDGDGVADIVQVDSSVSTAGFFLAHNGTLLGSSVVAADGLSGQDFNVLAAGDLNGDGIPDVVASMFASQYYQPKPDIAFGINDGHGNFTYGVGVPQSSLENNSLNSLEPFIADLNGDHKGDLVFATDVGLAIALGNGDGTFADVKTIGMGIDLQCEPAYVDAADLNGDGFNDLVVAYPGDASCNSYGAVTPSGYFVLLNNGDGTFAPTFTPFGASLYLPKLIDFNGDGKLDLAIVDSSDSNSVYNLYVFPGNGDGTFNPGGLTLPAYNTMIASIIPGDFDGDGKQDLTLGVVTDIQGGSPVYNTTGVRLYKGNGDFSFGLPVQYATGLISVDGKYADLNGDGKPDLALNVGSSTLYPNVLSSAFAYLANLGGGAFGPLQQTFSGQSQGGSVFTGDFNGDGANDVLIDAGIASQLYLNNGAIHFDLIAGSATIDEGSAATLTAILTPAVGAIVPAGTITLFDNGEQLENVAVSGQTTTIVLPSLSTGSHQLTASYSGDSNFNAATASAAVTVAVTPVTPNITLSGPAPASLTLQQGATGTVVLNLAANATFSGTVQIACSGAPAAATCSATPGSVTLASGGSGQVSVVVTTTAPNDTYQAAAAKRNTPWNGPIAGLAYAGVFLLALRRLRLPNALRMLAWLMLATGVAGLATGCGSDSHNYKYAGTPAGNYTLTVTATSGSISQTQSVQLTVTAAK